MLLVLGLVLRLIATVASFPGGYLTRAASDGALSLPSSMCTTEPVPITDEGNRAVVLSATGMAQGDAVQYNSPKFTCRQK